MSSEPDDRVRHIYADRQALADPAAAGYLLTAREGRRTFEEEIVPDLLADRDPQEHPVVAFVVGQQGAGKSRTAANVAQVLDLRGGYVDLDSDLYKPYHPR